MNGYGTLFLYALHFEVQNPRLNAARNIFLFDLGLDSHVVNNPPRRLPMYHVTYTFIVVGSDFQGDQNYAQSSFIFARNGDM